MNKEISVSFNELSISTCFWIFNGDANGPSGLKIENIIEAKRQKVIMENLIEFGIDDGQPNSCVIKLEIKDAQFLKTTINKLFNNHVSSQKAIGLLDIIERIEIAEEELEKEEIRKRIETKNKIEK